MDASQVLSTMNNTWVSLMDKYYDHIADEYLNWMSNEYNIPLVELKSRTMSVKGRVMESMLAIQTPTNIKKRPAKAIKPASNAAGSSEYAKMNRKELADLCKTHGLQVRRKNQDMIDELIAKGHLAPAPVAPMAPVAPAPAAPMAPAPVAPAPVAPAPVAPVAPMAPVAPAPVAPVAPMAPVAPVAPMAPVAPAAFFDEPFLADLNENHEHDTAIAAQIVNDLGLGDSDCESEAASPKRQKSNPDAELDAEDVADID